MERPCPAHGQPGPARWREARAGAGDGDGLLQKRPARRLSACAAGGLYGSESLAEVACTLDGIVSAGRHATVSASGRNHVTTPEGPSPSRSPRPTRLRDRWLRPLPVRSRHAVTGRRSAASGIALARGARLVYNPPVELHGYDRRGREPSLARCREVAIGLRSPIKPDLTTERHKLNRGAASNNQLRRTVHFAAHSRKPECSPTEPLRRNDGDRLWHIGSSDC